MNRICENCEQWIEHWRMKGIGFCLEHQVNTSSQQSCAGFKIHKLAKEGINELTKKG